jgi:D-alanyl-D-alanine carboxypeptidase (penicillin-binding protein 5/6)
MKNRFEKFFALLALVCLSHTVAAAASDAEPAIEVPPPPALEAEAWLLMDHLSGQVLAEHAADKPLAPASLTKLMTAYLVFEALRAERLKLDEPVAVSERAWSAAGARLFLRPGERVPAEVLIKGMIVRSANDATIALAERLADSETAFVAHMNETARRLGLAATHFANSTGLTTTSPHRTSARDLARLTQRLILDFPEYYARWFALREFTFQGIHQYNRNALLWRDSSVDGVKTGLTREAGHCLVASAERAGRRLIAVVLGARSESARFDGAARLLDYGFRHFETRLLYARHTPAAWVRVWMGENRQLPLGVGRDLYLTLPRGAYERLRARLTVREMLQAPVRAGEALGTLVLVLDRKPIAEYPLVALKAVDTGNFIQRTLDRIELWLR